MIERVSVKSIDDSCHGNGGRVVTVKPRGRESFQTPARPFSVPEFKAKEFLPFDGVMDGDLGAVQIDVKGDRYHHFLRRNGAFIRVARRATKYSDLSCCFENFMILDIPSISPDDQLALKLFLDLQLEIYTLNSLSIPPIATSSVEKMNRIVNGWVQSAEKYGKGAVPQIRLDDDPDLFKRKLKALSELADTGEIQIVNLVYADPRTHPHQYAALWERRETRVVFNCSGVPSRGREVAPGVFISPLSELQRHGVDTITRVAVTPTQKSIMHLRNASPPATLGGMKKFAWPYHPAGAVLDSHIWRGLSPESVECDCRVCRGMNQDNILGTYCYNEDHEIVDMAMPAASKLHDAMSCQKEYSVIRGRIDAREMSDYLEGVDQRRARRLGA